MKRAILVSGIMLAMGVALWPILARAGDLTITSGGGGTVTFSSGNAEIGARAYNTANISIPDTTATLLTFDSERWDTDTIHDTSTNTGRLTAKTAGKYLITGSVEYASNNTGMRTIWIQVNGTAIAQDRVQSVQSDVTRMTIATVYSLAVNDYVELGVRHTAGTNVNIVAGSAYSPEFAMQRIASSTTAGAGGAGEIQENFKVQDAKLPGTNPAAIDGGETNWRLLFDASTAENVYWQAVMDDDYAGAPLYADVLYSMNSATSGGVCFKVYLMAVTPGDSADINTESYDTANGGCDSGVPGTAGYLDKITVTLSNLDALSAGDLYKVKLERDVSNGTDTATGDAEVVGVVLRQ